ncbi:caspase family protein [Haliscomenobacter hydrossis]|uniref:Peptidase C14 caspase catalytic subunit p20 n=1 Tax=Haliscomenobacter hydrossis (strain ATCC 27775 / DSM 1100 / LMG 10767 / O) TaxID=760192 RepID=F4KW18_HALH1|nr:caspase family protein [Haliscomenobacter hydrossis]AEE48216.1 peptidase C14 caspase catalytic subunit p20 [Haliscomenobacter hydrossis DSM 1100]
MTKKCFALFIGINGYTKCNPLSGCINDVLAMSDYFEAFCNKNELEPHFTYLLEPSGKNEASKLQNLDVKYTPPTRANIIAATRAMFKQADPQRGDHCLFYYSGHGSSMRAPAEFSNYESSGRLQTLVCIDSRDPGNRDLIDKELGYLFAEGLHDKAFDPDHEERPGVHFLSIMDCCHSGNNTRGKQREAFPRMVAGTNQLQSAAELEGFDPKGNVFYAPLVNGKVDRYNGLHHARYIGFSASRDHESAHEMEFAGSIDGTANELARHGVFTWSLLRALYRSGGSLSYAEIMRRVEAEVRNQISRQMPLLWTQGGSRDDELGFFRAKRLDVAEGNFQISFKEGVWSINAGELHGIMTPATADQKNQFITTDGSKRIIDVKQVETSRSILDASQFTEADRDKLLNASIHQLAFTPYFVGFDAAMSADQRELLKGVFNKLFKDKAAFVAISKNKGQTPHFLIKSVVDKKKRTFYILTKPDSNVPLFPPQVSPQNFVVDLNQVGKWHHTLAIANPAVEERFRKDIEVEIQVMEGQRMTEETASEFARIDWKTRLINPDQVTLRYVNKTPPKIKVKISNTSNFDKYWVGTLYLDSQFGIDPSFSPVTQIGANAESPFVQLMAHGLPIISNNLDTAYHKYGVTEITDYLLIFVAADPFDLQYFRQPGIPLGEPNRDAASFWDEEEQEEHLWFTIKIPIHIQRPLPPVRIGNKVGAEVTRTASNFLSSPLPLSFEAPKGFSASVQMTNRAQVERTVAVLQNMKSAQTTRELLPPPNLWDGTTTDANTFCYGIDGDPDSHLSVMEFSDVEGSLSAAAPLQLILNDPLHGKLNDQSPLDLDVPSSEHDCVIPFGYQALADGAGFYLPMGFTDEEGNIQIAQLPSESPVQVGINPEEGVRSVSGSLKLFFQKIVWSRLSGRHEYNTLALHPGIDAEPVLYRSKAARYGEAQSKIQAILQEAKKVLLLIHGITGDTLAMREAFFERSEMHQNFDAILTFDYENLHTDIEKTAQQLQKMLQDCGLAADKRLTVVAHSMGGLVSRWWIEKEQGANYVHKLIQLGTPNGGVEIASFRKKIATLLTLGINAVERFKPYLATLSFLTGGLGKRVFNTLNQLHLGSDFLQQLNSGSAPEVPYYLLAGDTSHIEALFAEDDPLWKKIWRCIKDRGLYILADELIFDEEPNDLAVRLESMKALPWGHQRVLEPLCDHLSYFSNDESLEMLKEVIAE